MKKILLYSVLVAGMLSSCDLDINDDPDYPMNDQVTADLIFPAAQTLVASHVEKYLIMRDSLHSISNSVRNHSNMMPCQPTLLLKQVIL
jgi:hypothetical protein